MSAFRWRLASLWLSQAARVLADNWLRLFVVLLLVYRSAGPGTDAWHLVTVLWTLPAVLLAPFNGALCNSLPKPIVLSTGAALGFVAVLAALTGMIPWIYGWALVAVSFALYGPARYALYPAASVDARLPLPRLNGIFEWGSALAVVTGILLADHFSCDVFHWSNQEVYTAGLGVAVLQFLALAFALPVFFPSDIRRPESAAQAVQGFFRDVRRIWRTREARGCLIGLAWLRALILAFTGVVLDHHFTASARVLSEGAWLGLWVAAGVAVGSLMVSLQKHPGRVLGLVPWGALGFTVTLLLAACGVTIGPGMCVALGITFALVNVPLSAGYQGFVPADARGNAMAARNFCDYALTSVLVGIIYALAHFAAVGISLQFWLLVVLAAGITYIGWGFFLTEVVELATEWILWPLYRISAHGPGVVDFPRSGPVLVVANHCAWMDPFWLGKVLPRRFVPMMTSVFYDLPGVKWMLERFVHAIRVQAAHIRRDVPELLKAGAALDRGAVLLVFPEGWMRKREERLLKQFGQGVWHILQERPTVPVVVCWIEGGWGSYFSYYNGPPTKKKKFDFWRRIRIAIDEPHVVPLEVLTDLRTTRQYLMQRCLAARAHLGLDVPKLDIASEPEEEVES